MEPPSASRPRVTFFQPRVSQVLVLFSLFNSNELAAQKFLPKSHLSTVIIRDNSSVQRVQEIQMRRLEETRRKTSHFHEHLQKKFAGEQQGKMSRWRKEYDRFGKILDVIGQKTRNLAATSASLAIRRSQEGGQHAAHRER